MSSPGRLRNIAVVRGAVEDVLQLRRPNVETTLDALGASSLDVIELIMALEERLGVELPNDLCGLGSSILDIATRLGEDGGEDACAPSS